MLIRYHAACRRLSKLNEQYRRNSVALEVIQSLWIGSPLSAMERLTINSYLKNGHEFHLYVYDDVQNVPEGTVIKDANEIISRDEIFLIDKGYSSFSDFFRWKLIYDKGGWWSDLDAVCLKPFNFSSDHIFVGGRGPVGSDDCVSSGIFKAPKGAKITGWGWKECQKMDPKTMGWGEAGPPLFTKAVHKFGYWNALVPGNLFFPIFYTNAPQIFLTPRVEILPYAYSVHLFNEMWRQHKQDKNANYDPDCLYEKLKDRYGA
jgi:hypothetical protein